MLVVVNSALVIISNVVELAVEGLVVVLDDVLPFDVGYSDVRTVNDAVELIVVELAVLIVANVLSEVGCSLLTETVTVVDVVEFIMVGTVDEKIIVAASVV